ncbi:MAG: OmpA family protein [Deltaproteobacteria bacterium]|nr:OmpA family protein [Deltaproteobacteria bacterium]
MNSPTHAIRLLKPSCPKRAYLRRATAGALIGAIVLATAPGCVTDPYTGEKKIAKTAIGGVLGAGIGAGVATGIAALAGKDKAKAAMIGAGVGALGGAAIGGYMDMQEAKLRKFMEGTGVRVVRNGDQITLVMPNNITFATNSSELRSDFNDVLHAVSLVLTEYPKTIIEVMGHTDSDASDAYNLALSRRRADAVGNHLIAEGIPSMRVLTEGFGEQYPIASNDTPEHKALNRRVELRLSPLTAG